MKTKQQWTKELNELNGDIDALRVFLRNNSDEILNADSIEAYNALEEAVDEVFGEYELGIYEGPHGLMVEVY